MHSGNVIFTYNDGGRYAAGYKGNTGDCVTRAIAIVTGKPYKEVYDKMNELAKPVNAKGYKTLRGNSNARTGMHKKAYHNYLLSIGMKWTPTMFIGKGCKVHLKADELPKGKLIVSVSKHLTAVIDGVINDTYNPQRGGGSYIKVENGIETRGTTAERCVYGYYSF